MNRQADPKIRYAVAALMLGAAGTIDLLNNDAIARTADREQRAEFRAGRSSERAGLVEFSEGFQLTQGTLLVTSDSARLFRNEAGELERIELTGDPVNWTEELDDGSALVAKAQHIDYRMSAQEATLTGSASVKKAGDEMRAETIHYDLATQKLDAGGNSDEPVLFIYNPPGKKD
ncbi:MAG: lipopolysaccharide transport periplasmic protein LptA [Pseudomonadota bacterium]